MVRKEYEKPIVETVEFEITEYIMDSTDLNGDMSAGSGLDDPDNW